MKRAILLTILLVGCDERPVEYKGIPEADRAGAECGGRDYVLTCVAGGKLYACVGDRRRRSCAPIAWRHLGMCHHEGCLPFTTSAAARPQPVSKADGLPPEPMADGFYWMWNTSGPPVSRGAWTVAERIDGKVYVIGCDHGIGELNKYGPRIMPPPAPPGDMPATARAPRGKHGVAIFDRGVFHSLAGPFDSYEEAMAYATPREDLRSTLCAAYVLPEGESRLRAEQRGAEVEKALAKWGAVSS